jgi:hypothetical protein
MVDSLVARLVAMTVGWKAAERVALLAVWTVVQMAAKKAAY